MAFGGDRLAAALDRLAPDERIGMAVSGGPDSLALLLLAAAARPGMVEAATVDHGLRPQSVDEAAMVAKVCAKLSVPHATLGVSVDKGASLQAQARAARYRALAGWAAERGLPILVTAHHADDQAETLLMRLARGSGLGGLAGIREQRSLGGNIRLIRPLLNWRKAELAAIVEGARIEAVDDPANADPRHDRTRARALLDEAGWLDPLRIQRSAAALDEAEAALDFLVRRLATERLQAEGEGWTLDPAGLPREVKRRLLLAALAKWQCCPDGPETDRALAKLDRGGVATLGPVRMAGGERWHFTTAPPRTGRMPD